ncbi:MAG: hypothetical protein ACKV22_03065 [Bryobacteraceae bacterium]
MMLNLKSAVVASILLVSAAMSGCGSYGPYGGYAYRVPPPPRPMLGAVGYAPGPGYVWIDGFYDLRGPRWMWAPGYWVRPPRPRAVWARPYWEPHRGGYRFHRGYWR